jgi:hypothetical protein
MPPALLFIFCLWDRVSLTLARLALNSQFFYSTSQVAEITDCTTTFFSIRHIHSAMNVYIPPKFLHWNLITSVMVLGDGAIGRWLGHKEGSVKNGISALIKEAPESCFALSTMWGHIPEDAIYESECLN